MSKITKQDTNGVKPLLQVGELGYDNYPAGGDAGRVFVGTGTENIAQAKKSEVTAVDSKVDAHMIRIDNPHSVTKTQVGLSNVDNTSDVNKPVSTATQDALDTKITRPTSTVNRVVKFSDVNGSIVDSNLVSNAGGDLGLGVSPSAWHSSVRALETSGGSVFNAGTGAFRSAQNAYYSVGGFYERKAAGPATLYSQEGGEHVFYTASTGSAGTSVTFTERARINNAGVLSASTAAVGTNTTQVATTAFVQSNTENSLTSTSTTKALSAAQGKVLQDSKQANITGAATTITSSNLTASKALVSDTNGKVAASATTSTELGYLAGVSSNVQTQVNSKIGKVTSTDNAIVRFDGTTGDVQNSGVTIDDNNHIGIGTATAASNATTIISDTRLANVEQYGINNNLIISPETLTASRNYFGTYSNVIGTFANTTSYTPLVFGSYNVGTILSGSNSTANDGAVHGSLNQGTANNTTDAANKYIHTVTGSRGSAYINIAGYNNVENMYGVYADISSGGTQANGSGVTNAYGVFITNPISSGAVTNNYGLYQATAGVKNFFAGDTYFGGLPTSTSNVNIWGNYVACNGAGSVRSILSPTSIGVEAPGKATYLLPDGVTFSNVANSNGNTLDWYEEGAFTPTVYGSTTAGVGTYSSQQGYYTRIGNVCRFSLYLAITDHTGTGHIRLGGLPFISANHTNNYNSFSIGYVNTLTYTGTGLGAYMNPNTSSIMLAQYSSGATTNGVQIDTSFGIMISGSYKCA